MRALRWSLAGTVILMLLGSMSVVGLAQDEGHGAAATHVTGTVTANRTVLTPYWETIHGHISAYGGVYERDIEWSDPRLPSMMRVSENWDYYEVGGSDEISGALSLMLNLRLDGPDGAWTGAIYALAEETKPVARYPQTVLMVLDGEGAYEGLSAIFRGVFDEPPEQGVEPAWDGYIFDGPLTPMPEAPEPPASR